MVRHAAPVVVGLAVAASASASSIELEHLRGDNGASTVFGERIWVRSGWSYQRLDVGHWSWNVTDGAGPFATGSSVQTFCIELQQGNPRGADTTETYGLFGGAAPEADHAITDINRGLSDSQASYLSELFTKFYATAVNEDAATDGDDRSEAAAFQLAVWEIVGGDSELDVSRGWGFKSWASDATESLANSWLGGLEGGWAIADGLYGFGNDHFQDHMSFVMVPLPAGVMLGLAGLGGVALMRRRRLG